MRSNRLLFILICVLCTQWAYAQDSVVGSWYMRKFIQETHASKDSLGAEMLDESGLIWEMIYESDGSFFQQSNMNAEKRLDKMTGKWMIESNDRLTVIIDSDKPKAPIRFFYEFRDGALILERYDPMRTVKLLITMERKEGPL